MSSELRATLQKLVTNWRQGLLPNEQLHAQAEAMWDARADWPDYPHTDPRSIDVETLSQLEIMNHQLVTRDDAPAILAFLAARPGDEEHAWTVWQAYWQSVDFEERSTRLAGDPFYIPRR